MSATITIPAELEQQILGKTFVSGQQFEEFVLSAIRKAITTPSQPVTSGASDDSWLDIEYMAACAKEADLGVTLDSVRRILAKIPGSLADDIIAERNERF